MLKVSLRARADLEAIYSWGVDTFGVAQADKYAAGLTATFHFLAENPHVAREREETRVRVRAYRFQAHLIVFRIEGDGILVIRVRHGREDWLGDT